MPPQPLQIVISAGLRRKNVNQIVAVVGQDPFGGVEALDVHRILAPLAQLQPHFFTDGLDLAGVAAGADHKKVGKRGHLAQVEHADISGLFGLGRVDGGEPGGSLGMLLVQNVSGVTLLSDRLFSCYQ